MSNPFLSILMVTYNHEKFIAQSIDSVLMQKISFPYKLFIGEDCSTDQTREIITKYQTDHPDIIEVFYNKDNLGPQKNAMNIYKACIDSGAKYIAILDGDDYWTDPYKLQKQVDFLEGNPDYGMVCTDYDILKNDQISKDILRKSKKMKDQIEIDFEKYILNSYMIRTLTVCFRSILFEKYIKEIDKEIISNSSAGDVPLWCFIGVKSNIKFFPISTAVYRNTENTVSRQNGIEKQYNWSKGVTKIRKYFINKYPISRRAKRKVQKSEIISEMLYEFRRKEKRKVINIFLQSIFKFHFSKRSLYFLAGTFNDYLYRKVFNKYNFK